MSGAGWRSWKVCQRFEAERIGQGWFIGRVVSLVACAGLGGGPGIRSTFCQRSPVSAAGWRSWKVCQRFETKRISQGRFIGRVAGPSLGGDPRRRYPVQASGVVQGIRSTSW